MKITRVMICLVMFMLILSTPLKGENRALKKNPDFTAQNIDAAELRRMIKEMGARKTVNKLYRDKAIWIQIKEEIATGKKEWVEVATLLYPGSDAGTAEMIDNALGEALKNAPDLVLRMISDPDRLEVICGSINVDEQKFSTLRKSIDEVEERIRVLSRVKDPKLEASAKRCIAQLEQLIQSLHKYFEESED